jgi:hypothetical protein
MGAGIAPWYSVGLQAGWWGFDSRQVKQPGREADHSPPTSAEVKNAWSYTSTPQYTFMAWDNLTFTFTNTLHEADQSNKDVVNRVK